MGTGRTRACSCRAPVADGTPCLPPPTRSSPGVIAYRFEAALFYANATHFQKELLRLVSTATQPVHAVVLDTTGINGIDYSAAKMLLRLRRDLQKRDITMALVVSYRVVPDVLTRFGMFTTGTSGMSTIRSTPRSPRCSGPGSPPPRRSSRRVGLHGARARQAPTSSRRASPARARSSPPPACRSSACKRRSTCRCCGRRSSSPGRSSWP